MFWRFFLESDSEKVLIEAADLLAKIGRKILLAGRLWIVEIERCWTPDSCEFDFKTLH